MSISVVIPLYFCDPSLFKVIDASLYSVTSLDTVDNPIELIVIDDASPLDVPEYWHVHSRNDENRGFTATVNRGLEAATGDIIVVMNDDIVMAEKCLDRFLSLDPSKPTIASPADTASSPDDRFGACFAITRAAYELLGPLNEDYKNYYSDLDYYLRAKENKVEIIKWSDLTLEHSESSTYKLVDKERLFAADQDQWNKRIVE